MIKVIVLLGVLSTSLSAASPPYGLAAENHIRAQNLVDQIMSAHSDLVSVGIHCVAPGSQIQTIVASTLNVIGKPSDPPDVDVATHGETILSPNPKVPKLGVMLPLQDGKGKEIGALALAFKSDAHTDPAACLARAIAIRNQVAREIPSLASLFNSTP